MLAADLLGTLHSVVPCTAEDIPVHFGRISNWVEQPTQEAYLARMHKAVDEGSAFKLADNSCYFYYLKTKQGFAEGVCLNGQGQPMKTIALMMAVFRQVDPDVMFVDFHMHNGKSYREYRGLITATAVRRAVKMGKPLRVDVTRVTGKWGRIAEKHRKAG